MGQGGINEGTRHRCVVGLLGGSGGIKKGKHRYVVGLLGGSGGHQGGYQTQVCGGCFRWVREALMRVPDTGVWWVF